MKCDFCGKTIESGTEYVYVDATGKPAHFCSSKCEKNTLKLKRKPQNVRWTDRYRREKAVRVKSMAPVKPAKKPGESAVDGEPEKKTKSESTPEKKADDIVKDKPGKKAKTKPKEEEKSRAKPETKKKTKQDKPKTTKEKTKAK